MDYLTELHLHTKESSSCSKVSAKTMIENYNLKEYSTIVVTDHCSKNKMDRLGNIPWHKKIDYVCNGFDIAKEYGNKVSMNILLGIEITLQITDSDYLIYGISKEFLYKNEDIYEYSLEKLYDVCNKNGYLLIQAHPFRDEIQLAPLEYIDGIEVFNGCQDEVSRNDKALKYGNTTNKILTSGSDFHQLTDLAQGGIITNHKIENSDQLLEVLKSNNYIRKQGM